MEVDESGIDGKEPKRQPFGWFLYKQFAPVPASVPNFLAYKLYVQQGKKPSPRYRTYLQSLKQGGLEWKAEKEKFASASNNATYAGLSPFMSHFHALRMYIWNGPPGAQNPYAELFEYFKQFIMDRGSLIEDGPRQIYDSLRRLGRLFQTVQEASTMDVYERGMSLHDVYAYMSASPDLLIGLIGAGEIKCPYSNKYAKTARVQYYVPVYYMTQIQTVMAIFRRDWCDFISYGRKNYIERDPVTGQAPPLSSVLTVTRVHFNPEYWEALHARVARFIDTVLRLREAGIHELPNNTMFVVQETRRTIANSMMSQADIYNAMGTAAAKVWPGRDRREMAQIMRLLCDSGITDAKFDDGAYNPSSEDPRFRVPLGPDGAVDINDPRISDSNGLEYEQAAPAVIGSHIRIRARVKVFANIDEINVPGGEGTYGDIVDSLMSNVDYSGLQFYKRGKGL